jgi:hypothetical protein
MQRDGLRDPMHLIRASNASRRGTTSRQNSIETRDQDAVSLLRERSMSCSAPCARRLAMA